MRTLHLHLRPALIVAACLLAATPAPAQVMTVIHSFTGGATDGKTPGGSLIASGSTLYGMTDSGGTPGYGTVFQINTDGSNFGLVHSFAGGLNDGRDPTGSLVLSGTTLYGMTSAGGSAANTGTVFQVNTAGTGFGLLHSFLGGTADGLGPLGTLTLSGSTLYGMTNQGGTANFGVAFSVSTSGSGFGVIHSFAGAPSDGHFPAYSALTVSGSTLYGMTAEGGTADQGAIFKMSTSGSNFSLLHSFTPATGDCFDPLGSLTLVGSTLYGMASHGGGAGAIFKENTDGTNYSILHDFAGQAGGDGADALGSLLVSGSRMYGMTGLGATANLGTIFEMNLDGTGYTVMHSFLGGPGDGNGPMGDLTLVGSTLYGMTTAGGTSNFGTVFSIPVAVPEPSSLLLVGGAAAALAYRARRRARR